jgi:DNA-binding HxlR family transcriptional regulator
VLGRIGDTWTMLVISTLEKGGTLRSGQLKSIIEGITQKMLTQTLRALERDGLVTRTLYPTIPPRVDYELTDLGRDAAGLFDGLIEWAEQHVAEITAARDRYDQRADQEPVAAP